MPDADSPLTQSHADMPMELQDKLQAGPAEVQNTAASIQIEQPQGDGQATSVTVVSQTTKVVNKPVVPVNQASNADHASDPVQASQPRAKAGSEQRVVAKPLNDARGHTGFLTFARKSVDD